MASSSEPHIHSVLRVPTVQPSETQDKRLWLGNLDPRMSEFNLLKLLQKYGTIEKFDLLFHRSGPLAGHPRGYAFCTFKCTEDAAKAISKLDGQPIGNKQIVVRWAHTMSKDEMENKPKPELAIPVLAGAKAVKSDKKPISRKTAIDAIEAKLKLMEHKSLLEDFEVNDSPAAMKSKPYALIQAQSGIETHSNRSSHSHSTSRRHDRKPYQRGYRHR